MLIYLLDYGYTIIIKSIKLKLTKLPEKTIQIKMTEKKSEPLKKITIKQFQWYQVQTKVRELLTQLLQPFIKKQTQESIKINEIKRTLTNATAKLEDHDFLLQRQNAEKPKYIELQDQRIQRINMSFEELAISQDQQIREMRKVLEVYENKIKQLNELQTKIQQEASQRIKQSQVHKQHINEQIQGMLKRLDAQDGEISSIRTGTRGSVSKLQTKSVVLDNKLNQLDSGMKRRVIEITKINQSITKIHEKAEGHHVRIDDLTFRINDREKDQKLSEKFLGKVLQLNNQLSFIRNYLTLYQPLYNQMQISETINSFLKGTQKTRACLFEQKMFAKIHHSILTLQADSLETRMSQFGNRIRKIVNRNKKYVIKLKVEQTIKYGTNIYEIRQIDERILDKVDQVNSKPAPIIIPQEQIMKLVDDKWEKLIKGFQQKIEQKTKPVQLWINQIQQQSLMRMVQTDNRLDQFKKKLQRYETDFTLYQSDFNNFQKQENKRFTSLEQIVFRNRDGLRDLTNFCSVINHIVIQDEIDRQGLALYALKSTKNNNDDTAHSIPNIKLDQKCVSCNDPNSTTILNQAFKMACLAYNPSEIKIDDRQFSREQILEISTSILERLKKKPIDEPTDKSTQQGKKRSKSSMNRQHLHHTKNQSYRTIDSSAKRRQNLTLLPTLGHTARKKFSDKNTIGGNASVFY